MLPVRQTRPDLSDFDPRAEMTALNQRIRRFLDDWEELPSLLGGLHDGSGFTPLADVEETDDAYLVEIELPGVKRGDIDVTLSGRQLTVTGERKEKERTGILRRRTRVTGRFHYDVTLPAADPDAEVTAGYDDGVLTVRVPKPEADRPRRIPIR
jgi:HSP20 family protein